MLAEIKDMFTEIYDRIRSFQCDAIGHLLVGYTIVLSLTMLYAPLWLSAIVVVAAGYFKEKFDKNHPLTHTTDPVDFAITILGGVIGSCFVLFSRFI